jgi:hypothetical protein
VFCVCLAFAVAAACGDDGATPAGTDCSEGETRECYGGPPGTETVAPCRAGLEVCSNGRWPGICIGDVLPHVEQCNGEDDNCNTEIDDVEGVGEACNGTNGCTGARACDSAGRVRCFAPSKNECELCGGPDVTDVDDECTANGCVGARACSDDKTASVCVAPTPNNCGVCGAPTVTGLDVACTSGDGCSGVTACNVDGTAAACNAPMKNECLACAPSVGPIGAVCTAARGCVGVTACNGAGDAALCTLDNPCGHVVLSEIATGSSVCTTDEFIELYNPTTRSISLAGYTLWSRTASSGNFNRLVALPETAVIGPHGFYLVVSNRGSTGCANAGSGGGYTVVPGNSVTGDATYSEQLSATVGGVWLTTSSVAPTGDVTSSLVVDVVGWDNNVNSGDATVFEGTAPTLPPETNADGSIERKATVSSTASTLAAGGAEVMAGNGYDTDDNAANFVMQAARAPQNKSSAPEP